MSGPAVESLDLEGGLSALSLQLTKVKGVKKKKLNLLRKTIERFEADQSNLELWEDFRLNKTVADDYVEAYSILVETSIAKMQEEVETWTDKDKISPMVSKMGSAEDELRVFTEDKDELESSYFELAGSFHERQSARVKSQSESKPDTKKLKSADAIKPGLASLKLSPSEFQVWMGDRLGPGVYFHDC